MKLNEKYRNFLLCILLLMFNYSLCSTHEMPTSGYVSRRKSFCSMPFYLILFILLIYFFYYIF